MLGSPLVVGGPRGDPRDAPARCRQRRNCGAPALLLDRPIPIRSCRHAPGFSRPVTHGPVRRDPAAFDTLMPNASDATAHRPRAALSDSRITLIVVRKKVAAFALEVPRGRGGNVDTGAVPLLTAPVS